jgi:hypothetical protein
MNPLRKQKQPSSAPPKYVKIKNGVLKLNPDYMKWKTAQKNGPATTTCFPDTALAVVTNMDDHALLNEAVVATGSPEIPLAQSIDATIEMMQEPDICDAAGMTADSMVDELGTVMEKYEAPIGFMNKLMMLSEFDCLEFIIDDNSTMKHATSNVNGPGGKSNGVFQGAQTGLKGMIDVVNPLHPLGLTGKLSNTRWEEAQIRLKEIMEILAYVPFAQIEINFLNRGPDGTVLLTRNGRDPSTFLAAAYEQIDLQFAQGPKGGTRPVLEALQDSFTRGQGKSIARYFFGDGLPDGGIHAQLEITKMLCARHNPEGNPVTFLSCTNDHSAVEWMKDAEKVASFCSVDDDFLDEAAKVLKDQGTALPFTKGFHLICQLVAAMNPDDLDIMDEGVPFTKTTLDNLLGIQHNEESYHHYFNCFTEAQSSRAVKGKSDQLKKDIHWNYQDFLHAQVANQIPQVQQFEAELKQLG